MKKLLSIFLCVLLTFTVIPAVMVAAEESAVITVGTADAKQGSNVNIELSIADNPGILAMAFSITYDSTVLEYVGYENGYLSNYNIMDHADKGLVSFVSVEDKELNTSGTMLTLIFKVKENAPHGKYEIGIANNNPEKYGDSLHNSFANSKEQYIVPTVIKGYVNVSGVVKGDVNGDGNINGRDYAVLMQYLNDWEVVIVEEASDVNGDGAINGRDYALLLQYLNDWDVEFK